MIFIKGIRSNLKTKTGQSVWSGQYVKCESKNGIGYNATVDFTIDGGFWFSGAPATETKVLEIITDISILDKIHGTIQLIKRQIWR